MKREGRTISRIATGLALALLCGCAMVGRAAGTVAGTVTRAAVRTADALMPDDEDASEPGAKPDVPAHP